MTPDRLLRWLRRAVLLAHGLLIAGLVLLAGRVMGAIVALPLLLPLRGLWAGRRYTYAWCSLMLVFYCGGLLAEAYMRPGLAPVLRVLATVAAIEFIGLILFVRLDAAAARAAAAAEPTAGQTAE